MTGDSREAERIFRREAERHSGMNPKSPRPHQILLALASKPKSLRVTMIPLRRWGMAPSRAGQVHNDIVQRMSFRGSLEGDAINRHAWRPSCLRAH
jgi:hypothetical protein